MGGYVKGMAIAPQWHDDNYDRWGLRDNPQKIIDLPHTEKEAVKSSKPRERGLEEKMVDLIMRPSTLKDSDIKEMMSESGCKSVSELRKKAQKIFSEALDRQIQEQN